MKVQMKLGLKYFATIIVSLKKTHLYKIYVDN